MIEAIVANYDVSVYDFNETEEGAANMASV
jgi:hypothetical protein